MKTKKKKAPVEGTPGADVCTEPGPVAGSTIAASPKGAVVSAPDSIVEAMNEPKSKGSKKVI